MGLGGLTLAAVFFMVGGIFVPRLAGRRQALILSREGDRFSSDLRLLPAAGNSSTKPQVLHRTSMPLLRAEVDTETEVTMTHSPNLQAPTRPRSATTLRMTSAQTRELSALKARRAARISETRAAAQRRLVTVGATAAITVLVALLAAFSIVGWAWLLIPGALLTGAVVGSRVAAKNIEKAREREEEQFRSLQEQVDARGATRLVIAQPTSVHDEPVAVTAAEVVAVQPAGQPEETEAPADSVAELLPEVAADAELTPGAQSEEDPIEVVATVSEQSTWSVREFPAPASVRKGKVVRRSIHVDTDLVSVQEVQGRVLRPLGPTGTAESKPVAVDYSVDLDAVLEARRAQ